MIHNLQSLTAPVIPSLHQPSGVQLPQPQVRAQRVKALFVFWVPCLGLQINWAGFCDQKLNQFLWVRNREDILGFGWSPFRLLEDGMESNIILRLVDIIFYPTDRSDQASWFHRRHSTSADMAYKSTATSTLCITLPHRCFNHSFTPNPGTASKPNRVMRPRVHSVQQHSLLCHIF